MSFAPAEPANTPTQNETATSLSVTTTSATVALPVGGRGQLRVTATVDAAGHNMFIAFGDTNATAQVAGANSIHVVPLFPEYFTVPGDSSFVAAIMDAGTGVLYLASGHDDNNV